jgi:hypothetical protein
MSRLIGWQEPPLVKKAETDLERALRQAEAAAQSGFALQDPVYAIGTPVIQTGMENARLARKEFESLPEAIQALESLRDRVRAEKRKDIAVTAGKLRVDSKTGLLRFGRRAALLTDTGFQQLFSLLPVAPSGAARYLRQVPPDRRARETREIFRDNSGKELVLRLRTPNGAGMRQVYSVVTPVYSDFGPVILSDKLLSLVARSGVLREGTRADIQYGGSWTNVRLVTHSTVAPERFVAGEVFQAALSFAISDDKMSSIKVFAEAYRNLCLNLILIDTATQGLMSRRHVGDVASISGDLQAAAEMGIGKIRPFLDMWSRGRGIEITDMGETISILAGAREGKKAGAFIQVPHVGPEDMVERLMAAHAREPERSLTGLANAMTRASHESAWPDPVLASDVLQRQAGELLAMDPDRFRRIAA